jgi:2-isopropylmalate synthase
MTNKLIVFDTTLRDGEQSPGASMTADEKMRLARQLERLRVDVIEAGFPAASPGDFEAVQRIAEQVRETTICGLARANARDVGLAADAVKPAESPRIHTFIATSPIHMREKLRMSPDQVLEQAVLSVKQAKNSTGDMEFSPEDAGRSDEDFLCQILGVGPLRRNPRATRTEPQKRGGRTGDRKITGEELERPVGGKTTGELRRE